MTMNQDRPYQGATFTDKDDARLQLYRKTSIPEVGLVVIDGEAARSVSFSLNRLNLDRLIASLQLESELLAAPRIGERRRAPADHPYRVGCEAIYVDDSPVGVSQSRSWFVYRGRDTSGARTSGIWLSDAEVADWNVI